MGAVVPFSIFDSSFSSRFGCLRRTIILHEHTHPCGHGVPLYRPSTPRTHCSTPSALCARVGTGFHGTVLVPLLPCVSAWARGFIVLS